MEMPVHAVRTGSVAARVIQSVFLPGPRTEFAAILGHRATTRLINTP
jgi:hypothetical protein